MSSEQVHKTNQKIWRWERDSNIGWLAGGLVLVGGSLAASHPIMTVGLAVMVTARMGGEWIVETLKKNVVSQQKNMVEQVGDTSSVELMREAEQSQSIRPKVRTAISSTYITVGGAVLFAPLLTTNPTDGMFVASAFVGAVAGFTAGRAIEQLARKKFRFYDNAPGVATAVMDAVLKDKVLEQRKNSGGVLNKTLSTPKSKV